MHDPSYPVYLILYTCDMELNIVKFGGLMVEKNPSLNIMPNNFLYLLSFVDSNDILMNMFAFLKFQKILSKIYKD